MNLRTVEIRFSFNDWADDYWQWAETPSKIAKWGDTYAPNNYSFSVKEDESGEAALVLTAHNVSRSFSSFALLTGNGISILKETEYAPIHPCAAALFDFGDNK